FGRERKGAMGYIILGQQRGFCVSESDTRKGEWTNDGTPLHPESTTHQYSLDVQKPFEYGIVGGAGIEFSHPRIGHFALEGRYLFGLSDMFSNGKKDPFARSANSSVIVKLSYFWDIRKTPDSTIK
ncbi:MAG: PorT family protein, partial [Bacteroidaceae bacterium]|nr:PorT family protein [Bacteroidaceae bacterium]